MFFKLQHFIITLIHLKMRPLVALERVSEPFSLNKSMQNYEEEEIWRKQFEEKRSLLLQQIDDAENQKDKHLQRI